MTNSLASDLETNRASGRNASADPPSFRRVLLSCSAASPFRGSEPGLGWNLGVQLSKRCDVTMLVNPGPGEANRRDIEAYRARGGASSPRVEFVERPWLCRWLQHGRLGRIPLLYYVGYSSWQRAALRTARRLHAEQPFSLVHHVTIIGYREPGYLWKLGIPFFWGPIGGAANLPWRFLSHLGAHDGLFYLARNLVNSLQKRVARRPRLAARQAAFIWAATADDQELVRARWKRPADRLLEVGCVSTSAARVRRRDRNQELRLVWSGLHIGRKALPLLLQAMAESDSRTSLSVLGSGPLTSRWQALATRLRVADRIRWLGQLPHGEALKEMNAGDVFISTSVLESTSSVVTEALSLGLPVVCHDAFGMAAAVTNECGIKVPLVGPRQSIAGYAAALGRFWRSPELLEELSAGALGRSRDLSWERKAEVIARTYARVLSNQGSPTQDGV